MNTMGISLYLDYYSLDECKAMIDRASKLAYKEIFTSLNFEEYLFPGKRNNSEKEKKQLLEYAKEKGMSFHADITKKLLYKIGGNIDDLSCFVKLNIPVIRLDGGFSPAEIAAMTKNKLNIMIEDNLSNYISIKETLKEVLKSGNPKQYSGCLNFYPRNDTGLNLDEAVNMAKQLKEAGCKTGAFIGSLYSPTEMNNTSTATPSIEDHRHLPAYIQATELLCTKAFDFLTFGDSNPSLSELKEVAHVFKCFSKGYIEIPCYFEDINKETLKKIKSLSYLSRIDHSAYVIRGAEARGIRLEPYNTINRTKYSITMDNTLSNQYVGELQIVLKELPPERFINVIGTVKPYATHLLKYIHQDLIKFKLV